MIIGLPKETRQGETRVALAPEGVKKLVKKGFKVLVEGGAGVKSGFPDSLYQAEGAQIVERTQTWSTDIVLKIHKPSKDELSQVVPKMTKGALFISFMEPYLKDGTVQKLAEGNVNAMAMELIPRTSRAQSMDAL